MVTVTIASIEPDQVLDVSATDTSDDEIGEAEISMVDTSSNRSTFAPRDTVEIDWGNGIDWTGEVTGRPSESDGVLTYTARGEALPMQTEQAYRVFYNTESSEVVKSLATEQTEQLPETNIHVGDDPSNWTSQAPIAEAYAGDRAGIYDYGSDLLVLGAREGYSSEIRTTYDSVTSDAIEDGFFELKTRLIFPSVADFWDLIIELRTPGGASYRWEPDLEPGAQLYELAAEDAIPEDSGLSSGELRYRLIPSGVVAQLTLLGIDHASTIPFRVTSRPNAPSTSVEATGRTITTRVDGSVGRGIDDIATADDATWYLSDDTLTYIPGGEDQATSTGLSITDDGSTSIVDVSADRDYQDIINEVVVTGARGIEAVARDQSSIDFYGKQPDSRAKPNLTTEQAAQDHADGIIESQAWNDAEVTFTIANLDYAQLTAGDLISVTYSDEGLDGEYTISSVEAQSNGTVDVSVIASTGYS